MISAGPVQLRRLRPTDAWALVEAVTASLPELGPWFEWAQAPPDLEEQRERLAHADHAFANGEDYEFAMLEPDTGVFVGAVRLNPLAGPRTAGIGYWVRSDRHRRGYASSATYAITTATFAWLPTIDRIEIHMDQANNASVAVARHVGFELEREVDRDILTPGHTGRGFVWSITRTRWTRATS
jgi:RimJ/RimL family protein N-acetyltransferase